MPRPNRPKSILRLKVKGDHIKPGRIPIPELLVICEQAQNAVNRQAEALIGKKSLRPGPSTSVVKAECTLELFAISKGSAFISFAGPEPPPAPLLQGSLDLDMQQLGEAAVRDVVNSLRRADRKGPADMEPGVRRALEQMGELLAHGVESIEFIAPGTRSNKRVAAKFDERLWKRIDQSKETASRHVEIDGRLEEADFNIEDRTCTIRISSGQRIPCSFPTEKEDEVYAALRHVARISGVGKMNLKTRKIEHIDLEDVRVLNPFLDQGQAFFASRTLQQLTADQGVDPKFDLRALKGAWPEDDSVDDFLASLGEARS